MKVGTDGVLLGAWVNVAGAHRILDAGAGTGIISLMCAQRSDIAHLDAVEIDSKASEQAAENFRQSPWKHRLTVINDSLQNYALVTGIKYDHIVSNPPFFRNSLKPPGKDRSLARHDDTLNYESLLHYSVSVLNPQGLISLIMPASDHELVTRIAFYNGLYPVRISRVRPCEGKDFSRYLAEFSRDQSEPCHSDDLIIKKAGNEYTGSFRELTKDFYLKF